MSSLHVFASGSSSSSLASMATSEKDTVVAEGPPSTPEASTPVSSPDTESEDAAEGAVPLLPRSDESAPDVTVTERPVTSPESLPTSQASSAQSYVADVTGALSFSDLFTTVDVKTDEPIKVLPRMLCQK